MRTKLLALATRIRKMQESASPSYVIKDVRNTELAKILDARRARKEQLLKDCQSAREGLIAIYSEKKLPPVEKTVRLMELDSKYTALPLSELKKIDTAPLELDEMRALIGTLRRRGDHNSADDIYRLMETKKQEYKGTKLWKEIGQHEARISMLLGDDPNSLWIGDDLMKIEKEDFATVQDDGSIIFKDKGAPVTV